MWHWSQQPPISAPFAHGHSQSHTPSHTPIHQLPTHPMAVHHLTPQGMPSHFTSGQSPFVGYQPFNPGDFPHSSDYSNQMVAPPTQLHMPGGAGWSERHMGGMSSEHLLTAGYPTRGLSHDSVQGGPSVGQAMAALTPTLPQTSPLPSASTPLPLQTSPLVSPHVSVPQQPMPQLAHPAVGSSPFSVDFLLRERPATMEGGEIHTHSYTHQDMQNSNYTDRAEGIGRFATHTPRDVSTIPSGFGEGGEQSAGDLQQFANSSNALPQFTDPSDDLPQLSQQEVAEETAGGFPDKLSPFPLPSDFPSPSTPPEDSDKLTIALPPEKPFSPPQLVLIDREESQLHDLDQSDHPSIAMQDDITGSHVTGTIDSSPRPHGGVAQQTVTGRPVEEETGEGSEEKDPPVPPLAAGEPGSTARGKVSPTVKDKIPPVHLPKVTLLSRRPHMVRHKHDYESEDDDVFLPNSPHHLAEQKQQHSPEQSGRSQPHPPEESGQSQPHTPEQSGRSQPHTPEQSEQSQPHTPEQSGSQQPSPLNPSGWSQPHPPERSGRDQDSPKLSGWSQPHPPILSNKEPDEKDWGNPSSSAANEVPATAAAPPPAPPLVYRRRRGPRVAVDQEKIQLPLTKGWRRLVRTRLLPDQNPRVDICYVTPCGRRLRTFPEIQRYLDNKNLAGDAGVGVAGLELEHFSFSKKAQVGEMVEIGGKPDDSGEGREGLNVKRKSGRGRKKVVTESEPPEAGSGMDLAPSKSEGGGRGRGRRRGRPRDVAGRAGGLGRGARKQREEDQFGGEPQQGAGVEPQQGAGVEPQQGATGGQTLDQVVKPAGLVPLATGADPEGLEAVGHRISLEPHEISKLEEEESESHDEAVGFHGESHDVYLPTYGTINHIEGKDTTDGLSMSITSQPQQLGSPAASRETDQLLALSVDPSPRDTVGMATPILTVGQPLSATPPQPSPAVAKPEGVRRRGRKRKDPTRIEPQAPTSIKRPRGRPKGSGKVKKELSTSATAQPEVKKRRGRRPKLHPPGSSSTRHLFITSSVQDSQDSSHGNLGTAVCAIAGSPKPLKDGSVTPSTSHVTASVPSVSIIVPSSATGDPEGRQEVGQPSHGKTRKEEKRRQLLLKARVDRAKKKAESKHIQRAIITQRRLAQRQRRERERMLMKQARDRQEKLSKHKETEERELRRQRVAQQREVENQRRAQERTRRLLAHIRQQEVERERMALQHQRDCEKAEQLKRPTEDLLVADLTPLPRLHSMTWVVLPAAAFANLLMAVEFGRSFEEFLELGSIPSIPKLLGGLYSLDPRPLEHFCVQLLKAVLYSPGSDARTVSGCAVGRIEVREETLSELLRLYLTEISELEEIASSLWTLPLASLRPNEKAQLLGFLVEELLASTALTREVDTRMDQLAALRRDKWKISLKLKRFRSRLTEVYGVGVQKKLVVYSGRGRPPKRAVMGLSAHDAGGDSSDEREDPANPATNEEAEEDSESEYSEEETDEETPETKEELQKRIKVLKKKLQCLRVLIHSSSRQMRKFPLGQDRYARQYWLLPGLGGIIVEGVETSLRGSYQWDPSSKTVSGISSNEKSCVGGVVKEEEPSFHGHDQSDLSAGEASEVDVVGIDSEPKCGAGVVVGGCESDGVAKGMAGSVDGERSKDMELLSQSVEYQRSDDPTSDSSRHSLKIATGLQEGKAVPSERPEAHSKSVTVMGTGQINTVASSAAMVMETSQGEQWQTHLEDGSDGAAITVWNRSELDRQFETTRSTPNDIRTRLPFAESEARLLPLPPGRTLATTALDRTRTTADDSQPPSPTATPIQDQNSMESSPSMGSQTDTAPSVSSSIGVLVDESHTPSQPSSPPGTGTQDARLPSSQCAGETPDNRAADAYSQLECMETTPTFPHEEQDAVPPVLWSSGQGPASGSHDPASQSLVAHEQPSGPSPAPMSHDSGCPSPCPSPHPWFSIFPRQPCERATYATVDPSQLQLSGGQQFVVAAPQTAQYVYMTQGGGAILSQPMTQGGGGILSQPMTQGGGGILSQPMTQGGGAIFSQPMLQQVGVGYTLVGNTLVPQAQYISVNPSQAMQFVGQQGVQYVAIGGQQQPQGMIAIAGQQQPQGMVAIGGQQPQGVVAIGGQQPQGVVAIGGQQPQGVVAIGGQQPQGVVAIGGQQQSQGVVAIGGQQQPQGMIAIAGQQQPQGVVAIGGQQPQGMVAIGGQQPQGMVAIGGQQPQGVVAIGGQQPQGVVAIGGQQPQGVVAIGGQQPQGVVAIGGQQQSQSVVAIGGQQQPQGMIAIAGQQQPQGVVAIGGQQPQGMVAIGGQQPQGMVAIGGQQPQGVVAIGGQQPQGVVAIGGQQQSQSVQVVIGNQQTQGVVAIGGQQPQGMVAIGGQTPQGMVAVGAQQSQGVQYISLGGGQVAMVQQGGGEVGMAPVETPAEKDVSEVGGASTPMDDSEETVEGTAPEAMDEDYVPLQVKPQLEVNSVQHTPSSDDAKPGSYSPAMPSLNKDRATPESHTHKLSESEEIYRIPNPTSQPVVQGESPETTPSSPPTSQYLTAVLPTGPGGQSQYVTLPADPRVLAGQCSYAVLQQPDGTSQIVLVENSSLGYSQSGGVMSLECPPPSLMCNEAEGQPWLTDITLMYADHLPFLTPRPPQKATPQPHEKTLPQLLAEQDRGLTHGWWQVTDTHQVDRILRSLSHRGYREKGLFKALQKNKEHISKLLEPSELIRCHTTFAELTKGGVVRDLKEEVDGVKGEAADDKCGSESSKNTVTVAGDNVGGGGEEAMKVEGKPPTAEPHKEELGDKTTNHSSGDHQKTAAANKDGTVHERMFPELAYEAALQVLEYLEGVQERLFEAQLHSSGSRPHRLASELREKEPQGSPLPSVAAALLHLELSVDRRYLKPPLIARSLVEEKPRSGSPHKGGRGHRGRGQAPPPPKAALDAPPTTELLQWRSAVNVATSASQLAVCTNQLERCIAWEKSATKVFCKVCHSSENESLLLLCDGCDRGTHTYCCKPKLDSIPDGDWYCAECAVGKRKLGSCDICESPRGVLLHCTGCARTVHKRCLNPPLRKMPSLPWQCHKCKKQPPRGRSKGGAPSPSKKRPQKPLDDMAICRQMLRALEQHDEAGPFLEPVRKRKFPEYFRVIKRPMDFHTIKSRLREGRYPNKEAFAEEVRLVFSNCAFYNEDDSEIGVAGHCMKAFFEKRWSELSQ